MEFYPKDEKNQCSILITFCYSCNCTLIHIETETPYNEIVFFKVLYKNAYEGLPSGFLSRSLLSHKIKVHDVSNNLNIKYASGNNA